jgi:hypothetical protein
MIHDLKENRSSHKQRQTRHEHEPTSPPLCQLSQSPTSRRVLCKSGDSHQRCSPNPSYRHECRCQDCKNVAHASHLTGNSYSRPALALT